MSKIKEWCQLLVDSWVIPQLPANIDCATYEQYAKYLEAENAELKAGLEKAVELKAKVGDVIYMPWIYDSESDIAKIKVCAVHFLMDDSIIYATDLEDWIGEQEINFLIKYHHGNFSQDDFGVMVFTNKQAAEARLTELKK